MKRNEAPGTWRFDHSSGMQVVGQNGRGEVIVAHLHLTSEGGASRLRVDRCEHSIEGQQPELYLSDVDPPPLGAIEEYANQPGSLTALIDARDAEPGQMRMRLPNVHEATGKRPNSFYEMVAFYVGVLRENGAAVGPRLAADNDVPVSTVHRWIKEARQRGLLKDDKR